MTCLDSSRGAAREQRRQALQPFLIDYLVGYPCAGLRRVRHLRLGVQPRRAQAARTGEVISTGAPLSILKAEIRPCEVVCANCHRRRTAERRNWRRLLPDGDASFHPNPMPDRNLRLVYEHLESARCVDCGISDSLLLEHDHVGTKRASAMKLAWQGYGLETLAKEFAAREVRCRNCHRRRTAESGGWVPSARIALGTRVLVAQTLSESKQALPRHRGDRVISWVPP